MIFEASTTLLNIAYHEAGAKDNPVVLLLHGWPDDATTWEKVMPELMAEGYRVIAPYFRGFGKTKFKNPNAPRTGNTGIHALDMINLMDSLNIDTASVIGHDWGANVAEYLAVNWPDRVKSLAMISSTPRLGGMPTPSFEQALLDWYHWFQATKRGQQAVKDDPIGFAHLMWVNWSPKGWFDEEKFQQVAKSWRNEDFVAVTLHSYQSRWDEAEPDHASVDIENKVKLTKTGEKDGVNPSKVSEKVYEKFTGSFSRIIIPNIGHFPSREAPSSLSNHLIDFLNRHNS